MHIFIDENISPHLARALNHLQKGLPENHSIVAAIDKFGHGVPDTVWLDALKQEGNWVILSKDKFGKGDRERLAFREAGIPIFNLDRKWSNKRFWETSERLIAWWPTISTTVSRSIKGELYEISWPRRSSLAPSKV